MSDVKHRATSRETATAALAFLALACVFFGDVLFGGRVFFFRDNYLYFQPMKRVMAEAWRSGRFPLWNPCPYAGLPLLGDISNALLYPLEVLFLLVPFKTAFDLFMILHYPILAVNAFLLFRGLGASRRGAFLGAVAMAFGGYMVFMTSALNYLCAYAWAPLVLRFYLDGLVRGARPILCAGLAATLTLLAGDPQALYFAGGLCLLYTIFHVHAARDRRRAALRGGAGLLLLGAATALLSAAQLLPTLELAAESVRAGGLSYEEASSWSLHPLRLAEFLFPLPFGGAYPEHEFWGRGWLTERNIPWTLGIYMGLPVFLMALTALLSRREGPTEGGDFTAKRFLAAGFLLSLLLSLGGRTPLFRLFHGAIPLFSMFRYPEKWLYVASLCLAGLAALGFTRLENGKGVDLFRTLCLASCGAALALFFLGGNLLAPEIARAAGPHATADLVRSTLTYSSLHAFLAAGAALVALRLGDSRRFSFSFLGPLGLLLAASLADVLAAGWKIHYAGPPGLFERRSSLVDILGEKKGDLDGPLRIRQDRTPRPADLYVRRAEKVLGYPGYAAVTAADLENLEPDTACVYGVQYMTGTTQATPAAYRLLSEALPGKKLLRLYGVSFMVTAPDTELPEDWERVNVDPIKGRQAARVRNTLPKAFVVPEAVELSPDAAADFIASASFNPFRMVALPPGAGGENVEDSKKFSPAKIVAYSEDEVEIEAEGPGWLVLLDSWFPGWKAEDIGSGAELEILRANLAFRAVRLGPGVRRVAMRYRPSSFRIGLLASLLSLTAVLAYLAWPALRRGNDATLK